MRFRVSGIGGLRNQLDVELEAGVYVLRGPNGSGKTSALRALRRVAGEPLPLERHDEVESGEVVGPGVHLIVRKTVSQHGEIECEVHGGGHLATLIDPRLKDPGRANAARIRALLAMAPMALSEDAVGTLCGADPALTRAALSDLHDRSIGDLLRAAEAIRLLCHRRSSIEAREAEAKKATADAACQRREQLLAELGGEQCLVTEDPAVVREQVRELTERLGAAKAELRARESLLRAQAEVRASLGPEPDLERPRQRLAELTSKLSAADAEIVELRRQLSVAEANRNHLQSRHGEATQALADLTNEQRRWQKQRGILDQPLPTVTEQQVAGLAAAEEAAEKRRTAARLSAEYRAAGDEAGQAGAEADQRARRAEALTELATTLHLRLAELLEGTQAEGLTVVNGRLAALIDGQPHDFATRLSDGQRTAAALRVAALAYQGFVPLAGRFWMQLDPEAKLEFHRIARQQGVAVLTEEPASGRLRVEEAGS